MLRTARHRAKQKGIPFDLALDDIALPVLCPVLGIELAVGEGKQHPASPSLDQIIAGAGYVKGNVRVISNRANSLKNNGTLDELRAIVVDLERILKEKYQ